MLGWLSVFCCAATLIDFGPLDKFGAGDCVQDFAKYTIRHDPTLLRHNNAPVGQSADVAINGTVMAVAAHRWPGGVTVNDKIQQRLGNRP
jgi:hypothetical protein